MTKNNLRLVGQLVVVVIVGAGLLASIWLLTKGRAEETMADYRRLALISIIDGKQLLSSIPVNDPHINKVYHLAGGDLVYELVGDLSFMELQLLVRLDADGSFQEYRIISLTNHLQGWEFGNSFAYYELSNIENVSSGMQIWQKYILMLIKIAEEYPI